eukprot:COSAG02_NODE_517_length_20800_cov_18.817497_15_plen_214_part_00
MLTSWGMGGGDSTGAPSLVPALPPAPAPMPMPVEQLALAQPAATIAKVLEPAPVPPPPPASTPKSSAPPPAPVPIGGGGGGGGGGGAPPPAPMPLPTTPAVIPVPDRGCNVKVPPETRSWKPLRWLFLQTKDDAKERMDPFFHVLYTGAKTSPHVAPESVYWGPGMAGYVDSKSLKANIKAKYGDEVSRASVLVSIVSGSDPLGPDHDVTASH